MNPHRHQELVPLCRVCKTAASGGCLRCNAPLCEEHRPRGDRRCEGCEEQFEADNEALLLATTGYPAVGRTPLSLSVLAALLLLITLPAFVVAVGAGQALTATILGCVSAAFAALIVRTERPVMPRRKLRRARNRFLAERSESPRGD